MLLFSVLPLPPQPPSVSRYRRIGTRIRKVPMLITPEAKHRTQILHPAAFPFPASRTSTAAAATAAATTSITPLVLSPSVTREETASSPARQGPALDPRRCGMDHSVGIVFVFPPTTVSCRKLRWGSGLGWVRRGRVDVRFRRRSFGRGTAEISVSMVRYESPTRDHTTSHHSLSKLAIWTVGAESRCIGPTDDSPDMSPRALWSERTEPPIVVWALHPPIPWVVVETLPSQLAFPGLDEPDAHGHRPEIEVVRVLAVVPDLAEITEVVLAHCGLLFALSRVGGERRWGLEVCRGRGRVTIRTHRRREGTSGRKERQSTNLVI